MSAVSPVVAPSPGAWLFAAAVGAYQQYVSPWKGFRCAYRARHGRPSCSQFAKRVALRRGLAAVPGLLRERFRRCADAAKALGARRRAARLAAVRTDDEEQRRRRSSTSGLSPDLACDPFPCHAGAEAVSSCDGMPADACDLGCGAIDISC